MIEQKIEYLQNILATGAEFEIILQEIIKYYGDLAIEYIVTDKDGNECIYGEEGCEIPSRTSKCPLEDGYFVQVKLWQQVDKITLRQCEELFFAYWNVGYCDNVSGLPATDRNSYMNKCDETLRRWQQQKRNIAFFMIDLDHFKEVNTCYEHKTGTDVLSEFSRIIRLSLGKRGILIHESGDEFNIIFPYNKDYEVLKLAYDLKVGIENHKFKVASDIGLTMAMGVYLLEKEMIDFMQARKKAEEAYDGKKKNLTKQRDSIRILKKANDTNYGDACLQLALTRIICNCRKNIFHNIYLDFISEYVSDMEQINLLNEEINKILEWINPEEIANIRCTKACKRFDAKASFSKIEVGLAVLHGLLGNERISDKSIECIVEKEDNLTDISIKIDEEEILCIGDAESQIDNFVWKSKINSSSNLDKYLKRAVLVQAGYNSTIPVPEDIFYNIVRVDTRPSIGGALPDLWAAALSELITNMKENPNLTDIIIIGAVEHTKKVKDFLIHINDWGTKSNEYSINYISKKTFMSESDIIDFINVFSDHIFHITDTSTLIEKLYSIYCDGFEIKEKKSLVTEKNVRFLNRKLVYSNIELDNTHGCRAQSIAEAYPIVLEILRNSALESKEYIVDQAGRKLFELIDFKILLENPRSDDLPGYYKNDIEELENYYNKTFGDKTGLFKQEFLKHNQIDTMIRHIVQAITNDEKRYATRRAILVVPNEDTTPGRYPLGLVSVWLAPRFIGDSVTIDFSYTWRTVEALVGLPESMFASVKFAEELTSKIIMQCGNEPLIKMGKVSYIAHSLHMFLDTQSMNIIRGIINDVSV